MVDARQRSREVDPRHALERRGRARRRATGERGAAAAGAGARSLRRASDSRPAAATLSRSAGAKASRQRARHRGALGGARHLDQALLDPVRDQAPGVELAVASPLGAKPAGPELAEGELERLIGRVLEPVPIEEAGQGDPRAAGRGATEVAAMRELLRRDGLSQPRPRLRGRGPRRGTPTARGWRRAPASESGLGLGRERGPRSARPPRRASSGRSARSARVAEGQAQGRADRGHGTLASIRSTGRRLTSRDFSSTETHCFEPRALWITSSGGSSPASLLGRFSWASTSRPAGSGGPNACARGRSESSSCHASRSPPTLTRTWSRVSNRGTLAQASRQSLVAQPRAGGQILGGAERAPLRVGQEREVLAQAAAAERRLGRDPEVEQVAAARREVDPLRQPGQTSPQDCFAREGVHQIREAQPADRDLGPARAEGRRAGARGRGISGRIKPEIPRSSRRSSPSLRR